MAPLFHEFIQSIIHSFILTTQEADEDRNGTINSFNHPSILTTPEIWCKIRTKTGLAPLTHSIIHSYYVMSRTKTGLAPLIHSIIHSYCLKSRTKTGLVPLIHPIIHSFRLRQRHSARGGWRLDGTINSFDHSFILTTPETWCKRRMKTGMAI